MTHDVIMPKIDWAMTEGTLVEWLKKNGDEVKKGEPVAVMETQKATAEIESPASGSFYAIKPVGSVVPVFEKIAYIVEPNEKLPEEIIRLLKTEEKIEAGKIEVAEYIKASPLAKRIAKKYNIDLSKVKGTGLGEMVTKDDVLAYSQKTQVAAAMPAPASKQTAVKPLEMPKGEEEIIPLIGWRKTMSDHMSHSIHTAAQITTIAEVDATELVELRKQLREEGSRITYTAFISKAVVQALRESPILNSSLINGKIVVKKYYNLGIATEREKGGLIVPVIHRAERKSLVELAEAIEELTQKARQSRLLIEDVTGGTFTITNVGMLGVIMNTPIINPPESAILGVGAIVKRPVVVEDRVAMRWMMYLCLTYDHRIIDGALAIRFLQKVKKILENPTLHFKEGKLDN